jgi:hypothetical protein
MLDLPKPIIQVLRHFEPVFSERIWAWAQVLLVGAILTPGQRTVTAALRVMGLSAEAQYQNYHRVLNRAVWCSRSWSERLLRLLVATFVPAEGPIVLGLDDHIERRRGEQIAAKGVYRDAVRSSKSFFVKTSGLRWVSMMVLTKVSWMGRVWALPFLTVLAPSERYHQERGVQHKKLTDWARQMIRQVRRWLPERALVVVVDSSYAVLELLATCSGLRQAVTVVTRLRLDAALYDPAPRTATGPAGRPAQERRPPAQPGPAHQRPSHFVANGHCPVVWQHPAHGRMGEWHSRLVSPRQTPRLPALGLDPRSGTLRARQVHHPSPALYGPDRHPCTNRRVVRAPLATGGHL